MESETTPKATLTVSQPVAARKASMDFTFDEELPQTDLGHYDMEMRHFDEQSVNKEYDEQSVSRPHCFGLVVLKLFLIRMRLFPRIYQLVPIQLAWLKTSPLKLIHFCCRFRE